MNQTVECWGSNFGGAIGDGTTTDALVPTAVTGLTGVKSIATGEYSTCALLLTKAVTCWGINVHGELGNGTFTASLAPTAVPGLSRVRALSSHGDQGACALLPGGTARCWGDNFLGQLGDGTSGFYSANPVAVSNLVKARAISIGMSHACAVLTTSTVECWGDNTQGELGTGDNSSSNVPVVVPDLTGVKAISVGGGNPSAGAHTCALLATRTLECWGSNNVGQLGTGDNISSTVPVPVGLANVKAVAGNGLGQTTCALVVGGDAYCWGSNFKGQVGNGTTTDTSTPSLVPL